MGIFSLNLINTMIMFYDSSGREAVNLVYYSKEFGLTKGRKNGFFNVRLFYNSFLYIYVSVQRL